MALVSLFSGCGGMDLGFMKAGFKVVYANDFDKYAVETYKNNFGEHISNQNISEVDVNDIPPHNILIGGFPCQPFSMMGNQKGFLDGVRGTLFFDVARIIEHHKPSVVVLENVRNLRTHDKGNTLKTIISTLEKLDYHVDYTILDSKNFGVPQTRNRLFLVCIKNDIYSDLLEKGIKYKFPAGSPINVDKLNMQMLLEENVDAKYYLSHKILPTILAHGSGNYYSHSEIDLKIARPLTATMAKMHRANQDNYITDPSEFAEAAGKTNVRKLTPRECARLQGFPEDFKIVVSNAQAYKQFGNAVTVNVAESLANSILEVLPELINRKEG